MNSYLFKWLGCGLIAVLGLLAVTLLSPRTTESLRGSPRAAVVQAAPAAASVAQAARSQP